MTIARFDVSDFDDTELGAEVRAAYRDGRNIVVLYDTSQADTRAAMWRDGDHGLYRLRCENNHVWLSGLEGEFGARRYKQGDCTICGKFGVSMEDC